jgi:hypothetical protein
MFRAENKSRTRKASIPILGIFWVDDNGNLYSEGVTLRDAEDYGNFKIYGGDHYSSWSKAVSRFPQWRDMEYDEVPRGRVVYKKDPKNPEFIVSMKKKSGKHKSKIMSRFDLPMGHVRFDFTDEHYRT